MDFFEDKAGVRFPHARYGEVLTRGSEAQQAMNLSLIGERVLAPMLDDPQEDWAIAHELAHQWWGNSITCTDMSQFWLNEGVTTFMVAASKEHRWAAPLTTGSSCFSNDALKTRGGSGWTGRLPTPVSIRPSRRGGAYSTPRGPCSWLAFGRELGDEMFWRALKVYTRKHAGGTVSSQDFQKAFEGTANRDLASLFNEWVY